MDWDKYVTEKNGLMEWPYPVNYDKVNYVDVDVVVLGGGPAGVMASIYATRKGMKVALLDKAHPKKSGGGSGFDHWLNTPSPISTITPEDCIQWEAESYKGYSNSMSRYIAAREAYDTLLELEKIGAKIRDIDDEFEEAPFRDEKTKFLACYDYQNKFQFRVWGTTFKVSMFAEAKRLGVQIFDRVVATSLLSEGGKFGSRVVGATGYNIRTGEFYVFKAKAVVDSMSRHQGNWSFSTEITGLSYFRPNVTCDGPAIVWRAGGEFTLMEKASPSNPPGWHYPSYGTGNARNTWFPCSMVDADNKPIPWADVNGREFFEVEDRTRPAKGQKFIAERSAHPKYATPHPVRSLPQRIRNGEFKLPLYADLTSMPWYERKAIWGLMIGNEGRTRVPVYLYYRDAGFDPSKDLLQSYLMLGGESASTGADRSEQVGCFKEVAPGDGGGPITDWKLMADGVPGLFVAGDALWGGNYWYHACATGRYVGRHAAEYVKTAPESAPDQAQIEKERERVYKPVSVTNGVDWKELRAVSARVMQNYCGEIMNDELLKIGLNWVKDLEENVYPKVIARNPHELLRVLESYNFLICNEMIIQSSLARKASSKVLGVNRQDYLEDDPPEWHKFVTIKKNDGSVETGEKPIGFWGDLKESYEVTNKDYRGFLKKQ